MEVKLDKRYPVAATLDQAWAVLADIHAVARCMPGAQITEQIDATHYKGTVKSKVGPAVMQFAGDIEVLAMDAAARSMQMLGKGADKSGSSAAMKLSAQLEAGQDTGSCVLVGLATVTVSGKLAQFGSRLLVPVSDAMLAQFADNFRAAASVAAAKAGNTAAVDKPAHAVSTAGTLDPALMASHLVAVPLPASPSAASPPPAAAPVTELNALGLVWTVFKGWLAGLFGKRAG